LCSPLFYLFFFFMIPPPPSPTLFPYTTLFRSPARAAELQEATGALCVAWEGAGAARAARFSGLHFLEVRAITDGANHTAAVDFQDRKSTRLKSSHVKISYAVFCLKKKKKTKNS